jgi:hypothetical protein
MRETPKARRSNQFPTYCSIEDTSANGSGDGFKLLRTYQAYGVRLTSNIRPAVCLVLRPDVTLLYTSATDRQAASQLRRSHSLGAHRSVHL